jgi:hypothetical protein
MSIAAGLLRWFLAVRDRETSSLAAKITPAAKHRLPGFAIRYENRQILLVGVRNQFQNEAEFARLQPAFYKGQRFGFGTIFSPICLLSAGILKW